MNPQKTVIQGIADTVGEIVDALLGRKYYAVVVGTRGKEMYFLTSDIFKSRAEAEQRREELRSNATFYYVEMHSFRSQRLKL
jgi:hypothetical protein